MNATTAQIRAELKSLNAKLLTYPTWPSALARKALLVAELQQRGQTGYN